MGSYVYSLLIIPEKIENEWVFIRLSLICFATTIYFTFQRIMKIYPPYNENKQELALQTFIFVVMYIIGFIITKIDKKEN